MTSRDPIADALRRARQATAAIGRATRQIEEASAKRRDAVIELREAGWSHRMVADALGISRSAAEFIVRGK